MTSTGFIALTDPDWHAFLSSQPQVDEVNFWQPHGNQRFAAIPRGHPFFFKLRAPQRAIAGFGFFERYEALPTRLAWEAFGPMNGAASFDELRERLVRLRRDDTAVRGDFTIGCIMLSAPEFFPPDLWVDPPSDWPPSGIQRGKTYDLSSGEGARVFRECLDRAGIGAGSSTGDRVAKDSPRFGDPVLLRRRRGQGLFRFDIEEAYGGACAVTREHSRPVLEAAHIKPYALGGEHRIENGLLLRADLHKLFDAGYVTVTPDYEFRVGERLREEWNNGRSYYRMHGTRVALPTAGFPPPDRELLEWHASETFLG